MRFLRFLSTLVLNTSKMLEWQKVPIISNNFYIIGILLLVVNRRCLMSSSNSPGSTGGICLYPAGERNLHCLAATEFLSLDFCICVSEHD